MINVTKTFLPPYKEYTEQLSRAWEKAWITNNGELAHELEEKLEDYLGVNNLMFASNGTIVLQLALKALKITGEVITTPFSYVATTSVLLWEGCKPVYVDINPTTFCIDETKIEAAITKDTQAILATHVYGYPCNVEEIERIAKKHKLYVIYDAAHAFGTEIEGKSVLGFGDVSTCSFHATKVFHTGEGGCIVAKNRDLHDVLVHYRQFGHVGDTHYMMGINAKNSEFHAAMGLCNLKYIDEILASRKKIWLRYAERLKDTGLQTLDISDHKVRFNYAYFPVVFHDESDLLATVAKLKEQGIAPRRYFFPSLNTLHYVDYQSCPVSESIAGRVLCLPLYYGLETEDQERILDLMLENVKIQTS